MAASATSAFAQATPSPTPTCVLPGTGVHIELENPAPGDTLLSGTQVVMHGIAYDTGSTSGPGILSVTAYLGARDAGGLALGTAILGQPNPNAPANSPLATAGFTVRTPALPTGSGARSIFIYARSTVGNAEGVLEVPIYLNVAPTPVRGQVPTAVAPPRPTCTPTPVPSPTATATAVPPPAAPTLEPTATRVTLATSTPAPPAAAATPAEPPVAPVGPAAAATTAPAAVAPAQTTAPRGGGIPAELGLLVLGLGSLVVGGGMALRRRERR